MRRIAIIKESMNNPALDLALDEALLAGVNAEQSGSLIRFWQPDYLCAALGKGLRPEKEVCLERCLTDGVPVLKRCSGGGAVILSPEIFCFSFVFHLDEFPEMKALRPSYRFCGELLVDALRALGVPAEILPLSDVACGRKKISGNAQARKRRAVLHHGTIIMEDLGDLMEKYLQHPSREPEYRLHRAHREFATSLSALGFRLSPEKIQAALCRNFQTEPASADQVKTWRAHAHRLAAQEYHNLALGACHAV